LKGDFRNFSKRDLEIFQCIVLLEKNMQRPFILTGWICFVSLWLGLVACFMLYGLEM